MIIRDEYGIVVQHDPFMPTYKDGGDSSARTGILAMCGEMEDRLLMNQFETNGTLVRHPYQSPYNDPRSFTRDQLLQFVAGYQNETFSAWKSRNAAKRILWSRIKSGFLCQNTHSLDIKKKPWYDRDILTPSHMGHLIKVSKTYILYPFLVISWLWLLVDIFWSIKVRPNDESNQTLCMCAVAGDWALKLYCKYHYDWRAPITLYWSGWRNQLEIGQLLIKYIEGRIK